MQASEFALWTEIEADCTEHLFALFLYCDRRFFLCFRLRPVIGRGLDRQIIGIKRWFHKQQGSYAADHVSELARLVLRDIAPQNFTLPVADPLFLNQVATDRIFPYGERDGCPMALVIEINVNGVAAPYREHLVQAHTQFGCTVADGEFFR